MLVKVDSSAHWYTRDGEPRHDATLRVARNERLLPSVTSILKILAKPELEAWKQEQAVLSALTLPRGEDESSDDYARRVVKDSQEHSRKAAEFGSTVHNLIERYLRGEIVRGFGDDEGWSAYRNIVGALSALGFTPVYIEPVFVDVVKGYAGKVDTVGHSGDELVLIDFKTQGTKHGKFTFYPEWCWQLAAYEWLLPSPVDKCISLVASSTEDAVKYKIWKREELERGWEIFKHALALWKLIKKYDSGE